MTLRPYQEQAIQAARAAVQAGLYLVLAVVVCAVMGGNR